jgi:hypothetical protein
LANLRREDIARLGSARSDVGFRFDPGELRSKLDTSKNLSPRRLSADSLPDTG